MEAALRPFSNWLWATENYLEKRIQLTLELSSHHKLERDKGRIADANRDREPAWRESDETSPLDGWNELRRHHFSWARCGWKPYIHIYQQKNDQLSPSPGIRLRDLRSIFLAYRKKIFGGNTKMVPKHSSTGIETILRAVIGPRTMLGDFKTHRHWRISLNLFCLVFHPGVGVSSRGPLENKSRRNSRPSPKPIVRIIYTALFASPNPNSCMQLLLQFYSRVMLTAARIDAAPASLVLFRSYAPRCPVKEYERCGFLNPNRILAWKAARCTSYVLMIFLKKKTRTWNYRAAPVFFESFNGLADGVMFCKSVLLSLLELVWRLNSSNPTLALMTDFYRLKKCENQRKWSDETTVRYL